MIYLRDLLHGQLGISYTYRIPVSQLLGQYLGNTVLLLTGATIVTIGARHRRRRHRREPARRRVRLGHRDQLGHRLEPADILDRR